MGKKITQLATITEVADDDLLIGVDISDTSGSDDGTNKKFTKASLLSNLEHGAEVDNPSSGVHGVTGDVVGTTDTQTLTNKTLTSPLFGGTIDGWISAGETWTYASADDPTYTFTISGDKTSKYSVGMKIKLTQTTVKYFIITAISYSSPNTTVTVYGGTDYDLANSAISANAYSMMKSPQGFPTSPTKWSIVIRPALSQANATLNTYYASATTLVLPIGAFNISWSGTATIAGSTGAQVSAKYSLSTSTTSETDTDFSSTYTGYVYTATAAIVSSISKAKTLVIASKTTYYHVGVVTQTAGTTGFYSSSYISATCAYL